MALYNASLKNVITGTKQKYFHIDVEYPMDDGTLAVSSKIFVADLEKDDVIDKDPGTLSANITNTSNFYDWTNRSLIHNLYDITDKFARLDCRGYAFKNKKDLNDNSAASYSDIFAPKSYQTVSINQLGDYMYLLTDKSTNGAWYDSRFVDIDDVTETYTLSSTEITEKIYTAMFPPVSDLTGIADIETFSEIFQPTKVIDGIEYNHILEFPLSMNGLFKDNTLLANTLIGKNHLGYDYSQHIYPHDDVTLKASELRTYRRVGECGGNLYLVYVNDTSASVAVADEYINYAEPGHSDADISELGPDNTINYIEKFERIEVLKSVNRYATKANHKSNLFSVELNNSGLNETLQTALTKKNQSLPAENQKTAEQIQQIVDTVKKSVTNGIRNICEKIQPGNTQLFNVYFRGE